MQAFKQRDESLGFHLFRKRDIVIYVFIVAFTVSAVYFTYTMSKGDMISVRISGVIRYRFSLEDEGIKLIENNGKKLMDLVTNITARYLDAQIEAGADAVHLCERTALSQSGVLVCIPQKVIVTVETEEEPVKETNGIDLITG